MKVWPNSFTGAKNRRRKSCCVTAAKNGPYNGSSSGRTGRTKNLRSVAQLSVPFPFLGIGADGEAWMTRRAAPRRVERGDRHAAIDGDQAVLVGQNGIEIEFAQLGQISRQLRQLDQQKRDGIHVRGRDVA